MSRLVRVFSSCDYFLVIIIIIVVVVVAVAVVIIITINTFGRTCTWPILSSVNPESKPVRV